MQILHNLSEACTASLLIQQVRTDIAGRAGGCKNTEPFLVDIDDDTAFEDVMNTIPGGHFLETAHTLDHCRDAFQPEILKRLRPGERDEGGYSELMEKAEEEYQKIMAYSEASVVPDSIREDMKKIVCETDQFLSSQS